MPDAAPAPGPRDRLRRTPPPAPRICEGVIGFGGEDSWYHNRGHHDMQMMRELRRRGPVLYVNSIGMRSPSTTA